jgi:hypothetical protein
LLELVDVGSFVAREIRHVKFLEKVIELVFLIFLLVNPLLVGILIEEHKLGSACVFDSEALDVSVRLHQLGLSLVSESLFNLVREVN